MIANPVPSAKELYDKLDQLPVTQQAACLFSLIGRLKSDGLADRLLRRELADVIERADR